MGFSDGFSGAASAIAGAADVSAGGEAIDPLAGAPGSAGTLALVITAGGAAVGNAVVSGIGSGAILDGRTGGVAAGMVSGGNVEALLGAPAAAEFTAAVCGDASGLTTAAEVDGDIAAGAGLGDGFAATLGAALGAILIVGEVTGSTRTLVTMARAATGVLSGSAGRSISDNTTPAPAVAPIAVATRTTRAVRAKLGAGAR